MSDVLNASNLSDKDRLNLRKLAKFLPDNTAEDIFLYLKQNQVNLKIKKPRNTKLGDYRHPFQGKGHRISVNSNLNPYAFLITLVHEMAHLECWNLHKNKVQPHGKEWKNIYSRMLTRFAHSKQLPEDIQKSLHKMLSNPGASSCSDMDLSRVLAKYDASSGLHLENLKEGKVFSMENGKVFRKGPKLRTRYKCFCLSDKRWYYVHALVRVEIDDGKI